MYICMYLPLAFRQPQLGQSAYLHHFSPTETNNVHDNNYKYVHICGYIRTYMCRCKHIHNMFIERDLLVRVNMQKHVHMHQLKVVEMTTTVIHIILSTAPSCITHGRGGVST